MLDSRRQAGLGLSGVSVDPLTEGTEVVCSGTLGDIPERSSPEFVVKWHLT